VQARGHTQARGRLGVGVPAPVGYRPKVGDNGRDPPVNGSGRRPGCWAALGRAGPPAGQQWSGGGFAVRWAESQGGGCGLGYYGLKMKRAKIEVGKR
jgi:hypothetical protein